MKATAAAARIRELRLACGLSMPELGELAGLEGWRIGQIERGERRARDEELFSLAVALSVFARVLACREVDEREERLPCASSLVILQRPAPNGRRF